MRIGMLVMALCALAACKKGSGPEVVGPVDDGGFTPGFVDITFEGGDDELDDLMGSELMSSKAECNNLTKLEPAAMMGKLQDPEVNCLEDALRDADRQTYKRKISLLLMADAWAKGDQQRWEAIAARHLEQIDRSDPDLCYKYALYLSKKGPRYTDESIRWADAALENRTMWKGETHIARVYSLYRLKARASQLQWEYWEEKYLKEPTDEAAKERDDARNATKTMSREWLDYARSSGKDATVALQMCEAAAGTRTYCAD